MLQTLQIHNFALVEELEIEFPDGLVAITGETGAGKSILMGALSLLLGERADKTAIRTGESKCTVEATCRLDDPAAVNAVLDEAGIDSCEENALVLRRVISAGGSSRNFVNGCAATLQLLKAIGDLLVDMHGPHDHQSLLNPSFQMDILDAFGRLGDLRERYESIYAELLALREERSRLDCDDQQVSQQVDMLTFQIKEIEEADPKEGEEDEVAHEHSVVANAHNILQAANTACNIITEGDTPVLDALASVQRELSSIEKSLPEAREWAAEAESASIQLQELAGTISAYVHDINADPGRLDWLDDRLMVYRKLKKKYGNSVGEILEFLESAKKRLLDLETREERIAECDRNIVKTEKRLRAAGVQLTESRLKTAGRLDKAVGKELTGLGFAHGQFVTGIVPGEPGPHGMEEVDFQFAPNVGEAIRPLRAVASSGEISRVMLAVKTVLAEHDRIPVLVFDEIDANVGGEMGNAIGSKLRGIARNHQVLCITHLPQVAVHGTTQYVVAKQVKGQRTYTGVSPVEGKERVTEIARMLGATAGGNAGEKHARQMLRNAGVKV